MRVLTWVLLPLIVTHVVLATISGYRAIVQVYHVDVVLDSATLRPGSVLVMHVATSGRVPVDAELQLIQPTRVKTLAVLLIPDHRNASYNPFTIHASKRVVVTNEQLALLTPGRATLRLIASGRSQWLRVPPPVIAERSVLVAPR
jgi:hypothetical protein